MSRQIGYLVHYEENVEKLKAELDKLVDERSEVQQKVKAARDNAEEIKEKVWKWLTIVHGMKDEVDEFLAGKDTEYRRCFKVWFPDFYSRHRLGREAKKKTGVITGLITDGKFETVSRPKPLPDIGIACVFDYEHFESRGRVFKEIFEALREDTINVIGIYGMGGVGKTTMVEEVREQVKHDKHFDEVTWAVVSQNLDVRKIQGDIARGLKLNLYKPEDEVRSAGDPFLLGVLSEEEAWDLFKKEAGNLVDNAQIQPVAKMVCEQCGGLPLVVRVVGAALQNENKPAWDDALEQLRNSTPEDIVGIDPKSFSSLEWSYNRLEHEDARSCFLLCSLFPEDAEILIDDLARYAMVMGLLKHADTLEKANNRVRRLVETLKYSCLLLSGRSIFLSYNEEAVQMHDIIRDVAIKIASRDEYAFLVKTGGRRLPETGSFECKRAISLTSNEIEELPGDLNCPKLNTLFLECSHPSLIFPDSFFNGMEKLKVLHLSQIHTESLPSSLLKLVNLRMLCLDDCEIADISIIMELKKLEILCLGGHDIKVLPLDIRNLTLLRSLDLRNCYNFRGIAPDVITSLTRLEELYISVDPNKWEEASIPELNKLTDLTALGIHIPNTTSSLLDHLFDKLNRYKISIGMPFDRIEYWNSLSSSRALKLVDVPIRGGVKILMERSEVLYLHDLKGVKRFFSEEDREGGFSDLKYLQIQNCGDIENLWGYKQLPVAMGSFCKLSKLEVKSMRGLKYLFSPSIARGLMQLKELCIRRCLRMETIIGNEGEEDEEEVIFHRLKRL
ncbi:hypothetical protein F0562_011828 [Nyssa sinensis]|uniref:NB-ARC domain-containing protein n=1 Tax=Nyssa sinensis TaxID=561372 RepID=A0A5J4ZVL2_9ASTE|nr:hypothetical protein F0562_011828 [Nyssa sinensis]